MLACNQTPLTNFQTFDGRTACALLRGGAGGGGRGQSLVWSSSTYLFFAKIFAAHPPRTPQTPAPNRAGGEGAGFPRMKFRFRNQNGSKFFILIKFIKIENCDKKTRKRKTEQKTFCEARPQFLLGWKWFWAWERLLSL